MELMSDMRDHYSLAQYVYVFSPGYMRGTNVMYDSSEREQVEESIAPITYCTLQRCHLAQINDLLGRVFWEGIDGASLYPCRL